MWIGSKRGAWIGGLLLFVISAAPSFAQNAERQDATDSEDMQGLRLTPGMARGIAQHVARGALSRYGLPEDKQGEAAEKIARRIMQMSHSIEDDGAQFLQRFIEEEMNYQAEGGTGGFLPPDFGKEFADRVQPLLPAVRDLVRNVGQDIRPMLPMKQQLKLATDLMAVKTGIDGFEQTMKKWSSGEVKDFGDPFGRQDKVTKDENGESEAIKGARRSAETQIDALASKEWDTYLEQFKKFYEMNDAQNATADSILREFKERAESRKRDPDWRTRVYRDRMWLSLFWRLPNGNSHPLRILVQDDDDEATSWVTQLGDEFKSRLESIPTASQRKAADERVEKALQENRLSATGGVR